MKARAAPTKAFVKAVRRLPPDRQEGAIRALERFETEPSLARLDFRPLKGAPGHFIIDANHGDRIILRRADNDVYDAVDVGPHDNLYRRWKKSRR